MKNLTSLLKTRISIEKSTKIPDEAGGFEITWEHEKYAYAQVKNLGLQEEKFNDISLNTVNYKIIIRYDAQITQNHRININHNIITIKYIAILGKSEAMELNCVQNL